MRRIDRFLQDWRARKAKPWVPFGARVLDIGSHQGEFLLGLGEWIADSVGLDPLTTPSSSSRHQFLQKAFVAPAPFPDASFDAIVLLATLEHIRDKAPLGRECARLLRPGGRVIITVPAPCVDAIIGFLCRLGLADGMSLEEHHGFDPATTPTFFTAPGLHLEHWSRFQLGLNHLLVFCKPGPVTKPLPQPARSMAHA